MYSLLPIPFAFFFFDFSLIPLNQTQWKASPLEFGAALVIASFIFFYVSRLILARPGAPKMSSFTTQAAPCSVLRQHTAN
jgi:hypothetical protein